MRSLALKKLRLDYEAGISPQTAKPQHELVLIEWGCQGESKDPFVQKSGGNSRIVHSKTKTQGFGTRGIEKNKVNANV